MTGFHLWSQTYDRDLNDVLQLQTDIANAVATALQLTLLRDAAAKIEAGASLVQFYTGMIYRGPALIGDCVDAIRALHRA